MSDSVVVRRPNVARAASHKIPPSNGVRRAVVSPDEELNPRSLEAVDDQAANRVVAGGMEGYPGAFLRHTAVKDDFRLHGLVSPVDVVCVAPSMVCKAGQARLPTSIGVSVKPGPEAPDRGLDPTMPAPYTGGS